MPDSLANATDLGIVPFGSASVWTISPLAPPGREKRSTQTCFVHKPTATRSSLAWRQAGSQAKWHLATGPHGGDPRVGGACNSTNSPVPNPTSTPMVWQLSPEGTAAAVCKLVPAGAPHHATRANVPRAAAMTPERVTCNKNPGTSHTKIDSSPSARPGAACSASTTSTPCWPSPLSAEKAITRVPPTKLRTSRAATPACPSPPSAHRPSTMPTPSKEPTSSTPTPTCTTRNEPVGPTPLHVTI
mmetsp:Transcript_94812/g.267686  ORF Transcript_94812/g.267686 Transcript_94812/m.267686 type:complete len:244 (+) Transcript_94812:1958-2689(+)